MNNEQCICRKRKPDDYLGIARVYPSDHTERNKCLQQLLYCLLLYLTFHLLHVSLSCSLYSFAYKNEKNIYIMFKMLSITSIFHCVIPEIAKIHCSQPVKRRRIQLQESPLFHDAAETLFICSFSFESTSFIFLNCLLYRSSSASKLWYSRAIPRYSSFYVFCRVEQRICKRVARRLPRYCSSLYKW